MRVATISSWKVEPARRPHFIEQLEIARAFHVKHGGRVSVWNHYISGSMVGTVDYWIVHDNNAAMGEFTQRLTEDLEYQTWFENFQAEAGGTVVATRLVHEVSAK